MVKRIFIVFVVSMLLADPARGGDSTEPKNNDLTRLDNVLIRAKTRVRKSLRLRAGDLLRLLPAVNVGKSGTFDEIESKEFRIGISININQIWEINDNYNRRDALKTRATRQIETCGFIIRKYIDRKYLLKDRLWKFSQIKKSMDNPMDIATMDEKIDELKVKIQEIEINIEKAYAEIEYACVDVER